MTQTAQAGDLVTSRVVAARFGVTVTTVRRWVRENRIPYVRLSRRTVRFRLLDIERNAINGSGIAQLERAE